MGPGMEFATVPKAEAEAHTAHVESPPDASSWDVRVTQTPECSKVDPDLLPKEREDKKAQLQGLLQALTCGVPGWNHRGLLHPGGGNGEERWRGEGVGSSETPALAQPLPVLSRRGFHGGRVWQGGTISRQIQSTTVLSAMRPIFSTSEPPPERTAARIEQPDRKTETAWTVLATVATLPLTPLLPQPASCIHAVKPSTHAPTRDKHALPPLRIRAVQVFNTRPRADHGPTALPDSDAVSLHRC
ncbi:hypothetical protein LA080_013481 [Diaporthe eres]|nr:hypothetical protein LA080_013481 [Diaporthe eres]